MNPSILIIAGEASGELATVMDKLATYSEGQQALQQKIGLAMVYPAIVIFVAVLVVGGLLAATTTGEGLRQAAQTARTRKRPAAMNSRPGICSPRESRSSMWNTM